MKGYRQFILPVVLFLTLTFKAQSIANYVANGSFEETRNNCGPVAGYAPVLKNWSAIDTTKNGFVTHHVCYGTVPSYGTCYQWPRTGEAYAQGTTFCGGCPAAVNRSNFRNRLKAPLQPNKIYCVKFYVNVVNPAPIGIDGFGAYFSDNTLDTITYPYVILSYLNPQIQNAVGNIVTDTLNWSPITGTFTAIGNEKFMVITNFKSDINTMTAQVQPTPGAWCDINLDDVSCIDIDLPAEAGPDAYIIPGTFVYVGRPHDVGIDEACMWYQLPNMVTAIDTAAGIWVAPIVTTTYVVRQEICGNVKWDTVVVHMSGVGLAELKMKSEELKINPNPANDVLNVSFDREGLDKEFTKAEIMNSIGQLLTEIDLNYNNKQALIDLKDLPNGVYLLNLKGVNSQIISKRFVVAR